MPLRLNREELIKVIESLEARGADASELRRELAAIPVPAKRRFQREEEELTPRERLNNEVGDLFVNGVTEDLFAKLVELDRSYSLEELRTMCRQAGLSCNGDKKKLAARLVASGVVVEEPRKEVEMTLAQDEYVDLNKQREWIGKPGQSVDDLGLPEAYLKPLRYEIIVFVRKERGGHDFLFRCRDYEYTPSHGWRFEGVIIDSSIKKQDKVQIAKLSYHPEVMLVDVGFMVTPAPEDGGTSTRS